MKYALQVDENYHYMDESERFTAGEFESLSEAIAAAKRIVDRGLIEVYEKGMTAERLHTLYLMFGEDPFIVGGPPESDFRARDYARGRCDEICAGQRPGTGRSRPSLPGRTKAQLISALDIILPRHANNEYRGGRVPFYGFCLLSVAMLFRSTVHFLVDDSGVNSIASIVVFEGTPDPNNIIYMFSSVGGLHQMLFVMLYGLVLWRYRNLIPLMFAFMIVEVLFGFCVGLMHPLTPEYYEHTPPGKLASVPMLVYSAGMLFLAIRRSMPTFAESEAEPGMV